MKARLNSLRFPVAVVVAAANDAAFDALSAYHRAERELAHPVRRRPAAAVHSEVLRAQRIAESLARASASS